MTHEEYNKFCEDLQSRGYRKYFSPRYSRDRDDYAWFKSVGESAYEEDRSNYQICFDVFDFSPYADREPYFREHPFSIEPMILVSRSVNERVDLHLSHCGLEDTEIDEYERLAESFFQWADKNIKVKQE